MKKKLLFLPVRFILLLSLAAVLNGPFFLPKVVHAQDDWQQTFNQVCAKTQNAMSYSPEELRDFIAKCDDLKAEIEGLQEPQRTIFLKRLQKCKGVFVFVLESKDKN